MGWKQGLKAIMAKKPVVVGVGNALKGDDGAGTEAIGRLDYAPKLDAGVMPENHIFKIQKMSPTCILIIDAVDFGGKPGEVRLMKAGETTNPNISTHSMPLSIFARFFPDIEVWLLGIQPETNMFGSPLSESVAKSVAEIAKEVRAK